MESRLLWILCDGSYDIACFIICGQGIPVLAQLHKLVHLFWIGPNCDSVSSFVQKFLSPSSSSSALAALRQSSRRQLRSGVFGVATFPKFCSQRASLVLIDSRTYFLGKFENWGFLAFKLFSECSFFLLKIQNFRSIPVPPNTLCSFQSRCSTPTVVHRLENFSGYAV